MKVEQDVNAYLAVKYVGRKRPQFFTELVSTVQMYHHTAFICSEHKMESL